MLDAEEIRILIHPESEGKGQQRQDGLLGCRLTCYRFLPFPLLGFTSVQPLGSPLGFLLNLGKALFSHYLRGQQSFTS